MRRHGVVARLGIERPTLLAGIGLLLSCVLPIVLVRLSGSYPEILGVTLKSLLGGSGHGDDFWAPIGNALRYLATHKADDLYQATYFQSDKQFIYSPLSLAFCRLTQWPPLLDWLSPASLNHFSLGVLFATVGVAVVLFNAFYGVLGLPARQATTVERIARILIPAGAALLFFPLMWGYWIGNIQTWLTGLIILSLLLWLRGYRLGVGACLGLVCVFKPAIAPILLWALLRREYRVIAGFMAVVTILGLASLWMFGPTVHLEYFHLMGYLSQRGESFYTSHSINSLLNRAMFNGPNLVWDGSHSHMQNIAWIHYATVITSLMLIAAAMIGRRQSNPVSSWLDYAVALTCITMASPVLYEHHLAFTLVLFMMAGVMLGRDRGTPSWLLWLLTLGYFLMANHFASTDLLANTHFNVLQSYHLASAFILLGVLFRLRTGSMRLDAAGQDDQPRAGAIAALDIG